jgi:hypothetical protein
MLECAGYGFRHAPQQTVVDVGQFHQSNIRSEAEGLFHQEKQRIREKQQYAVYHEVGVHTAVQFGKVVFRYQFKSEINGCISQNHQDGRAEQLRALR